MERIERMKASEPILNGRRHTVSGFLNVPQGQHIIDWGCGRFAF